MNEWSHWSLGLFVFELFVFVLCVKTHTCENFDDKTEYKENVYNIDAMKKYHSKCIKMEN